MKKYYPFITLALLLVLPMLGFSTYVMHIFILLLMWATIGMAWNLLSGYCGQVSFGHAAFFGIGAYTAGILYSKAGVSPWFGLPLSVFVVGVFAFIIGLIVLRLRGPFFALATLASGEVFRVSAENMEWLTSGTLGIMLQKRLWVSKEPYYYIILAIAVTTFILMKYLVASKLGYFFVAIREDQDAAESMGINTTLYKTIALVVSGMITGVAGAFYMNYMGYIDPHIVFALHDVSIITIMIVMVGGVATQWGPFVGAVIMVMLQEAVRSIGSLGALHQAIFGLLLIFIIIFLPNGIVGDFRKIKRFFGLGRVRA
ncbi:branched-chain amino acid ABC transporter permease [Seleniivibrio sp.]|uniref:branched-chain amino acid ABC transporter permease n=1 Tax=Seleniivibrio sp. TaxID=2898801 RepID=UPI0025F16FF0|nr:branched-chain amino acid ABC transporter permease [Seleniivibrio sp.]MCD8552482.1 branched-chain amino acid ABC transporter permease [Seleniivibrio sp.]